MFTLLSTSGIPLRLSTIASKRLLGIPNVWDEDAGPNDKCCIFISEAYSMIGEDIDRDEYGKKIEAINMVDYGMMNGKKVLDQALSLIG